MAGWITRALLLAALAGLVYAVGRSEWLESIWARLPTLGVWAMPAFVVLHTLSVVAFVPSLLPTFAAGALFGVLVGLPLTVLGAALGAALAFALGRTLAHDWVRQRFGHSPRFLALSKLARTRGWRIVALARLTPVFPFAIANYAFGATPMKASHYFLATLLGTIPSNAVYVYLGAVAGEVASAGAGTRERTPLEWGLLFGGLAVAVGLAVYLRRLATEVLEEAG